MPRFNYLQPPEDALSPAECRITDLRVEPWPDGRRIRVLAGLTPFLERPNLTALITEAGGEEVSSASIIETIDTQLVFTMHIRPEEAAGPFTLTLSLTYPDLGVVDTRSVEFALQ